ncbi:MAG: uroporphyrinogen-III synthase [Spirochaetia bacterium]|nr:uroporphyrinogen-III synthase [Spirochaetia bacterium]
MSRRILITRPLEEARAMANEIAAQGGQGLLFPVTRVLELQPSRTLGAVFPDLVAGKNAPDWILFTSQRAVDIFSREFKKNHSLNAFPKQTRIAAVGPTTEERLKTCGFPVHLVPKKHVAEGLLESIGDVAGKKILIPRSREGREILARELKERGADVHEIFLYTMEALTPEPHLMEEARRGFDAVIFASPSGVKAFFKAISGEKWDLSGKDFFVMGLVTRVELEKHGSFKIHTASIATSLGLVDAALTRI